MEQKNGIAVVLIVIAVLSMAGCDSLEKKLPVSFHEKWLKVDTEEDQLGNMMYEFIDFAQKDNAMLEQAYLSAKEKFEMDSSYQNRFRYVLMLTLPNSKFSDQANALALLEDWSEEEQLPASWQSFRRILIMRLEEEARLRNQARNLMHQLTQEKMNAETLQKKIEDIKDMEKTLIRRNIH